MHLSQQSGFLASIFGMFTPKRGPKITPETAPEAKINSSANFAIYCLGTARAELEQYEPLLIERGFVIQLAECKDKLQQFSTDIEAHKLDEDFTDHFDEQAFFNFRNTILKELIDEVRTYTKPEGFGLQAIKHMQTQDIDPMTNPKEWKKAAHVFLRECIVATGNFTPETIGGRCHTMSTNALGYVRQQHRLGLPL